MLEFLAYVMGYLVIGILLAYTNTRIQGYEDDAETATLIMVWPVVLFLVGFLWFYRYCICWPLDKLFKRKEQKDDLLS